MRKPFLPIAGILLTLIGFCLLSVSRPVPIVHAASSYSIHTLPDIAGSGSKLAVGSGYVVWVQFYAPSGNTGCSRIGDVNIGSARGICLEKGLSWKIAVDRSDTTLTVNLGTIYTIVPNGDTLQVSYLN